MSALPRRADRIAVIGVVNVTPDSFSDGGRYLDVDDAVAHGLRMRAEGADLVDVGGESTRPGAQRVPADEELRRIAPVIAALAAEGVPTSVDTYRAEVAAAALELGATIVNDVSGGLGDPDMGRGGARRRVSRGSSCTGAGTARTCASSRSTTTSSRTSVPSCSPGSTPRSPPASRRRDW